MDTGENIIFPNFRWCPTTKVASKRYAHSRCSNEVILNQHFLPLYFLLLLAYHEMEYKCTADKS